MKTTLKLICLAVIFSATGCKYFKSDHPQSEMGEQASTTGMNEQSIQAFANHLDQSTEQLNKKYSLVYTIGDGSLYVEQYSNPGGDHVLIENVKSDLENAVRKYYFKRDSLVLVSEHNIQNSEKGKVFKDTRTYLRNFVVFKRTARTASSAQAIDILPYLSLQNEESAYSENFRDDIRTLNDALVQRNKFDMVFDNVTTYPDATFLMLKSKEQNGYKASIRLVGKDQYIDSLLNYPGVFKNEKLDLNWKVSDLDAVYVPEESTSTSASGLNK